VLRPRTRACPARNRPPPFPTAAPQVVKLKAFSKFQNTTEALAAATALVDSKLDKGEASPLTAPLSLRGGYWPAGRSRVVNVHCARRRVSAASPAAAAAARRQVGVAP
jgi:hypothetical protein